MTEKKKRIIASRYEIKRLIGRGGMSNVYLALDNKLNRTVAVKILKSDLVDDPSFLTRFSREAKSSASLNHPSIVSVYDADKEKEENTVDNVEEVTYSPYIVMEYVEGKTLKEVINEKGKLDLVSACNVTLGVLAALEYSHKKNIVHRDIKPGNVIITKDGEIKVMDFGIARAIADSSMTITETRAIVGTAQYISPEQARGDSVDARSDLYSTGCVLYEMLTGVQPFIGDSSVSVVYQHVNSNPPLVSKKVPNIDEKFDLIILRSMAKRSEDRYQSAKEFKEDIIAARDGKPLSEKTRMFSNYANKLRKYGDGAGATEETPIGVVDPMNPLEGVDGDSKGSGDKKDKKAGKNKARNKKKIIIISAVAAAILAVFAFFFVSNVLPVSVPEIPSDATEDVARNIIENVGLKFEKIDISSFKEKGKFVKQDPPAGTSVSKGSTVTAYFSKGADSIIVPSLKGYSQEDAVKQLHDLGLEVRNIKVESSKDVDKDKVTRTDPPAGKTVKPESKVDLYVSSGLVDVPNVIGKKQAEAEKTLSESHLIAKVDHRNDSAAKGTVISQNPSFGSVEKNSTVLIVVSDGPETVVLPNLIGKLQGDAIYELQELGLSWDVVYEKVPGIEPQHVFKISPAAGTRVPKGSKVIIYVAV